MPNHQIMNNSEGGGCVCLKENDLKWRQICPYLKVIGSIVEGTGKIVIS